MGLGGREERSRLVVRCQFDQTVILSTINKFRALSVTQHDLKLCRLVEGDKVVMLNLSAVGTV